MKGNTPLLLISDAEIYDFLVLSTMQFSNIQLSTFLQPVWTVQHAKGVKETKFITTAFTLFTFTKHPIKHSVTACVEHARGVGGTSWLSIITSTRY